MERTAIGKLVRIRRYPVKSMAGEDLNTTYVHETGINGDRIYAFYDPNSERHSLPYITIREINKLLLIQATIINEKYAEKAYSLEYRPQVQIKLNGSTMEIDDDRVQQYLKENLGPRHQNLKLDYRKAGIHDTKPISIASIRSIDQLSKEMGYNALDPLRFRSNFYVEWEDNEAYYEEKLVGKSIQIGNDVILHIAKSNIRCTIINVDPDTAEKDSQVLKTVTKNHNVKFGIYGEVRNCGPINVNDTIYLVE